MSWKKALIWAAVIVVVLRFRNEIAGALSNVPVVNKIIG